MKKISTALLLLIIISFFLSCKKGEDDPAISLRTRKARLAGEWRLKSGKAALTYNNIYNESYVFEISRFTYTKGNGISYIGTSGLTLTIKKDGTFSMNERLANLQLGAKGTWNFNTGVGEEKKKEDVVFMIDNVTTGSSLNQTMFNRGALNFVYHIKELKNKELVISSVGKAYVDPDGRYVDLTTEYTFIQ